MRFVAGSNPAARTTPTHNTRTQMSYHDGYIDPNKAGMAVVNPLLKQQRRLRAVEKLLKEIAEETDDPRLKERIKEVLNER
tara:strand:+ start:177 stop:419 length:243 start_codon:yes stop_codon:yes gene_type:complete